MHVLLLLLALACFALPACVSDRGTGDRLDWNATTNWEVEYSAAGGTTGVESVLRIDGAGRISESVGRNGRRQEYSAVVDPWEREQLARILPLAVQGDGSDEPPPSRCEPRISDCTTEVLSVKARDRMRYLHVTTSGAVMLVKLLGAMARDAFFETTPSEDPRLKSSWHVRVRRDSLGDGSCRATTDSDETWTRRDASLSLEASGASSLGTSPIQERPVSHRFVELVTADGRRYAGYVDIEGRMVTGLPAPSVCGWYASID